jgi:RNA polymerase sigma-70 factor (ECF subfamily)
MRKRLLLLWKMRPLALSQALALANTNANVNDHTRFLAHKLQTGVRSLCVVLWLAVFCSMNLAADIAAGLPGPTDEELLHQMARGDESALGTFYDRHSTLLYSIAIKVLGDMHEAEEVLQDGLRQIWERAALYDASLGQPLSWAVVITRHKAIDRMRAQKRRSDGLARLAEEALVGLPSDPAASAQGHACEGAVTRLHGALGGLPRDQTAAIELAFFKGMSQTEISTQLGVPLGTVKARIRRGMIALRDALEDQL